MINKKYIIVGAIVAIVGYLSFCSKADAQQTETKNWKLDTEVGYYEKRISGGLYGAQEAGYIKAATKVGNFSGLAFVGSVEYVDAESYQLHSTLGTYLQTPIGGVDTRLVIHSGEAADTTYELNGAYDLNWFDFVDTSLTVAVENGDESGTDLGEYITTPSIVASKTINLNDQFDAVVGGEYGQSIGLDQELEFTHVFARLETVAGSLPVFVQWNWVKNNLPVVNNFSSEGTDGEFDESVTAGIAFSF
tara:strand:+ start:4931 stop:5674 length:744 start_codon:yes stop_codon:yes gene_type:complete